MSVVWPTPQKRIRLAGAQDETELYARSLPAASRRPPPRARVERAPILLQTPPGAPDGHFLAHDGAQRAAEGALRQRPRRRHLLFIVGLMAILMLDGAVFGRIVGWWWPTQVVTAHGVPGIFVPATLRALANAGFELPSARTVGAETDLVQAPPAAAPVTTQMAQSNASRGAHALAHGAGRSRATAHTLRASGCTRSGNCVSGHTPPN